MENNRFNKAIKEIKNIRMTDMEKESIRRRVLETTVSMTRPVKSPWSIYSFSVWIRDNRWSYAVAVLAVVMIGGGGLVSASGNSLPGDTLYSLKVNFVEPIRVSLAGSAATRASLQSGFATERLMEAETLAVSGTLDVPRQAEVQSLLDRSASALSDTLEKVRKAAPEKADDIEVTFQAGMNAHARLLDTISAHATTSDKARSSAIANAARKHSKSKASLMMEISTATSTPAISSPAKTETKNKNKANSKRDSVQSIIDATSADLEHAGTGTSPFRESVLNETRSKLEEARKSLEDSDIIDSERSAKEASIFLKGGLRFDH